MLDYKEACAQSFIAAKAAVDVLCAAIVVQQEEHDKKTRGGGRASPGSCHSSNRKGKSPRQRTRRTVEDIYKCLGDTYFRRAYRMSYESFWVLHEKLQARISHAAIESENWKKKEGTQQNQHDQENPTVRKQGNREAKKQANYLPPPVPNGHICTSVRLACALRYFAGASPYDLMVQYGLSYAAVLNGVWYVVDAINRHSEFFISYPADHSKQLRIAAEFCEASSVNFDNCAGAIDGILIWTHKPSFKDAERSGIGLKKLYCGRKNKFGLNCQAVADKRGRFLDISICYGGSTSDCLAFEASDLWKRLEAGLLLPGLTLFGDNAYLNKPYMAIPYQNVRGGSKDDYNFYHSQVISPKGPQQRTLLSITQQLTSSFMLFCFFYSFESV